MNARQLVSMLLEGAPSSPEFHRWFAGSQVVDADGQPQVCYHGTNPNMQPELPGGGRLGDIKAFDRNATLLAFPGRKPSFDNIGSWFSSDPSKKGAEMYGSSIYPVYLSIKNPLLTTFKDYVAMGQRADKNYRPTIRVADYAEDPSGKYVKTGKTTTQKVPPGRFNPDALRQKLIDQGYDGLKFSADQKVDGGSGDVWVAFEPNQVKSAIANRGAYSDNPDIAE